jgi:hypothetical protein
VFLQNDFSCPALMSRLPLLGFRQAIWEGAMRSRTFWVVVGSAVALLQSAVGGSVFAQDSGNEIPLEAAAGWKRLESQMRSAQQCFRIRNLSRATGEVWEEGKICIRGENYLAESKHFATPNTIRVINGPTHNLRLSRNHDSEWQCGTLTTHDRVLPEPDQNQLEVYKDFISYPYCIFRSRYDKFFDLCRLKTVRKGVLPERPSLVRVEFEYDKGTPGTPLPNLGNLAGWIDFDAENDWRSVGGKIVFRDLPAPDAPGGFGTRYYEIEYLDGYKRMAYYDDDKPIRPGFGGTHEMETAQLIPLEEFYPAFYGIKPSSAPRFWQRPTFWLAAVGVVCLGVASWARYQR